MNAKIMTPDSTLSSSPSPIKLSGNDHAASKLKISRGSSKVNAKASKTMLRKNRSSILEGFLPGKYDVLCNRSRHAFHHVGNRRFRIIVENHGPRFARMTTKAERSTMIQSIVDIIASAQGKFVEMNKNGGWDEVGLVKRKEKVGHALRAAVMAGKSQGKPRTIYEVLGGDRLLPPDSTDRSSTRFSIQAKTEEVVEVNSEDDLFGSFASFDKEGCADDEHEGALIMTPCTDIKLPQSAFNKFDDETKWMPFTLADALISNLGVQVSSTRPMDAYVVCSASSDAVPSLQEWPPKDAFGGDGEVDFVFEMFKPEDTVIPCQDLQNQLEDTVMGLDDFFSANPEVAY